MAYKLNKNHCMAEQLPNANSYWKWKLGSNKDRLRF